MRGPAIRDLRDLPDTLFEVTYTPSTVRVDQSHWAQSLQSISRDGYTWVFAPGDTQISRLSAGKILLLENLAVLRVIAVAEFEGHPVLAVERAGLPDLIQHGKIAWKVPVRFASSPRAAAMGSGSRWNRLFHIATVHADESDDSQSGDDDGWKYALNATPGERRLDMDFTISKEASRLEMKLHGKGHIDEFITAAAMTVDGGMADMSFDNSNFSGDFNFDWSVARTGDNADIGESKVKLPSVFTAPLPFAGIPFVLSVGEEFILKPGFGAPNELANGSFSVSFGGGAGVTITNGNPTSQENAKAQGTLGRSITVSIAPHAVLIAVCVPKVTLGLGTESGLELLKEIVPSALADRAAEALEKTTLASFFKKKAADKFKTEASAFVQVVSVFTIVSAGAANMIPCKVQKIVVEAQAGADATILGHKEGVKTKTLFKMENILREPDIKFCQV